jgi:hypothetical protein
MTPKILAKITDNKLEFADNYNQKLFQTQLQKFNNQDICLVVDKRRTNRSVNQNAYYWSTVIGTIAKELGYQDNEADSIHHELREKFLSSWIICRIASKKSRRKIVKSTTDLDTLQFEEYMSAVRSWASAELNIFIPEPNNYV